MAPAADAATPAPTTDRAQRYSAQLTLAVKDIDGLSDATQKALQITRDLGGYVVSVSYATSDTGVSSLTLKVPTANVQDALVRLTGLGKIVAQQVQIDDLQGQVDELTKRETALRGQIARLSARLAGTDLDAETRATLEARRDAARSELAQVGRERAGRTPRRVRHDPAHAADVESRPQSAVPSGWDKRSTAPARSSSPRQPSSSTRSWSSARCAPAALVWLGRRGLRNRQEEELLSAP